MQGKGQVSEEVINQIIIKHDDYVVTPKRICCKLASGIRPYGPMVKEKMRKLQEMGLGQLVKVEETVYFYRAIPRTVEVKKLAVFQDHQ